MFERLPYTLISYGSIQVLQLLLFLASDEFQPRRLIVGTVLQGILFLALLARVRGVLGLAIGLEALKLPGSAQSVIRSLVDEPFDLLRVIQFLTVATSIYFLVHARTRDWYGRK